MKYNVIYCDVPWTYGSKSAINNSTGNTIVPLSEHYKSLSTKEVKELPINEISADDCACFFWVTDSHLKEGIEVLEKWGFKYTTIAFNWIKKTVNGNTCVNVAPWTLKSSEICLLGTKGTLTKYKKNNSVMQLVEAERTTHSKKPDEVRKRIETLFGDIPRIELFARDKNIPGWDAIGDGIDGKDIRESLQEIIKK